MFPGGFRLSVISDEVSQDLIKVAEFAKRFNLDAIEIRTVWNKPPHQLLDHVSEISNILSRYGLKVCGIASPFFKCDIDNREEYILHLDILRKCCELARKLDVDIVRGFTFWRKGRYEDYEYRIIELFQKPLEIIEDEGIILAIENEPATFTTNGRLVSMIIRKLGSKYVKAVWDPGNDVGDPYGEKPYPEGYSYVKPHIIHIHIKDAKKIDGDVIPVPVGEGDVDFRGQFKALRADGYKGYLSLETHWRPRKRLTEEQIVRPGGAEFSEAGEEASEVCMHNLIRILESL
jgi:sugar phosphate isomerase/epimerase